MSAAGVAERALRVGFVGVGIAGQSHLFDALTRSDVEVVAVCGRRRARAADVAGRFAVERAYDTVDELIATERPAGVVVATPPRYLALHATRALGGGAHVLVEKPAAACDADLERLLAQARATGRGCAVAYTRRYKRGWHDVRERLRRRQLGELRELHCRWQGPYRSRYATSAPTYRADPFARVGGVVLDTGCHIVDLVQWLTGATATVADARLTLDGDGDERNEVRLVGSDGTLTVRECAERVEIDDGRERRVDVDYVDRPIGDLVRLARGAAPLGATLAEAAAAARVVFAVYARAGSTACADKRWLVPRAKPWGRRSGAC